MEVFRAEDIQPPAILHRQLASDMHDGSVDPSLMRTG